MSGESSIRSKRICKERTSRLILQVISTLKITCFPSFYLLSLALLNLMKSSNWPVVPGVLDSTLRTRVEIFGRSGAHWQGLCVYPDTSCGPEVDKRLMRLIRSLCCNEISYFLFLHRCFNKFASIFLYDLRWNIYILCL